MRYEQIVQFLNDLPKTDFFDNPENVIEYKAKVNNFNVNQNLLDKLNEEYKIICEMSKNYVNDIKPPQTPFKYYTNINQKFVTVYFAK